MEKQYCYKYPRPALTTDCVVFGFDGADLSVLLIRRANEPFQYAWAFPGGFLEMNETVEEGVLRELREETGIILAFTEQVKVFSAVDRDPRGRIITVAFYTLVKMQDYVPEAGDDASRCKWCRVDELPPLAFDHEEILQAALVKLQERLHLTADDRGAVETSFSAPVLQRLYDAIANSRE